MLSPADWRGGGSYFTHAGHQHFVRRGGAGQPLLLIHGYPTNSWDWHRVWDSLTAHFSVIAPDMLGMGFSDKPRLHRYGVFDHADMHEALLRDMSIDRVHVVAHDLGVSVAQELLARQREDTLASRIATVVFLNGGLFAECYQPRLIQRLLCSPLGGLIGPRVPRRAFDRTLRELFGPRTQPDATDLASMWEIVNYAYGRRVTHRVGRFVFDRVAYRDRLVTPLIEGVVPMRLINGSRDPNSGVHMAKRYRELVRNPDVVDLPEIGHWPQLEAPVEVAAAILEFLKS